MKHKRWILTSILLAVVMFMTLMTLDAYRQVRKIGDGSLWQVPSRIYSRAYKIEPGTDIALGGLEGRLERLGYRQEPAVTEPGEFSRAPGEIGLYLRAWRSPAGEVDARRVRLVLDRQVVERIVASDSGQDLAAVTLEPECMAEIFGQGFEDRSLVAIEDCPPYLIEAILATEDRRFYRHWGIDVRSVLRATLVNLRHGSIREGASTITQQLIKNLFLSSERSFVRKFREMWIALLMEAVYSKDRILEMYLNEIYMGQWGHAGIYGVGRAARLFFDKDVAALSLEEAALLAGIIRAPNRYAPHKSPGRALGRRNTVLHLMLAEEMITPQRHAAAVAAELDIMALKPRQRLAPYFVDHLLETIREQYPLNLLARGGYRIFTTIDMHMQLTASDRLDKAVTNLARRKGPPLQGAVVICDPRSGALRAMVGGCDYATSQFNRATRIRRHIGSLVKPVIYYTALRRGYALASLIDDTPLTVPLGDGTNWEPQNYDHQSHGRVMLIDALAHSYNQATVRLGLELGTAAVMNELQQMLPGFETPDNPAALLGALSCSPLDMAGLYSGLANGGRRVVPLGITVIVDQHGTVVYRPHRPEPRQVWDPSVVFLVNTALREVLLSGTGRGSYLYGMPPNVRGKTGTTDEGRDAWFVGLTDDVVVAVWLGNDDYQPVGLTGASGALPVAAMIMAAIVRPDEPRPPDDIVFCAVDPANGKRAALFNPDKRSLPFLEGTEPTEVSRQTGKGLLRLFKSLF